MVIVQKMSENAGVIGCQIHAKKFGSNPVPGHYTNGFNRFLLFFFPPFVQVLFLTILGCKQSLTNVVINKNVCGPKASTSLGLANAQFL